MFLNVKFLKKFVLLIHRKKKAKARKMFPIHLIFIIKKITRNNKKI